MQIKEFHWAVMDMCRYYVDINSYMICVLCDTVVQCIALSPHIFRVP